jgi:hypothetical protein
MLDSPATYGNYLQTLNAPREEVEYYGVIMAVTDPADPNGLIPLVPGGDIGEGIAVTGDNRNEYVKLASEMEMRGLCSKGLAEMR